MTNRFRLLAAALSVVSAITVTFAAPVAPLASAPATTQAVALPKVPSDQPSPKMDPKTGQVQKAFAETHAKYVERAKQGNVDLYFEGDSITNNWRSQGKDVWAKEFSAWNAANFGIGGDRTEHVLWRMDNGELDGVHPKAVVLMIGTNNTSNCSGEEIAAGVTAIVNKFREKQPQAKILLLAIFPRGDVAAENPPDKRRLANEAANALIAKLDDGKNVKFLNFNSKFGTPGTPEFEKLFPDKTHLHPGPDGYQIWADAIKPTLTEWLGAPTATAPATK